jgi:hypothetical protein
MFAGKLRWSQGIALCGLCVQLGTIPVAWAQGGGKAESKTVTQRESLDTKGNEAVDINKMDESYQAKGVDLGQYLFFPQIESGGTWNSNIYAQRAKKSDFIGVNSPSFRLQSRFENHALDFNGQIDDYRYASFSGDNHTDGHLGANGRLDVTHDLELTAFIDGYMRNEDRSSPDAIGNALKPTPTQGINSFAGIKQVLNKLTLSGRVGVDRLEYANVDLKGGGTKNNEVRDRTETTVLQRAGYEFSPGYSAVLQTSENQRVYDQMDSGVSRNSQGYRIESGLGVDISQLLKGDVLVGYMNQDYNDSSLGRASGVSATMSLNWTPDELTLILPALSRSVQETTTAGASSMVETTASLLLRHEFLRNLVSTAYFSIVHDTLVGPGQVAWTGDAKVGSTYSFTPEVFVRGEVEEKMKTSQVPNSGFEQTLLTLRFGVRL